MLSKSFAPTLLRAFICAALLLVLAGCGDDQEQPATDSAVEAPEATAEAEPEAEALEPEVPPLAAETDAEVEADTRPADPADEPVTAQPADREPETHTVRALATAFDPMVVFIEPGDSVSWINMTGHDSRSLDGLIPEGAEPWASQLGQNVTITLTVPGVYIYKCTPHYTMGMAGAIVVGEAHNLDEIDAKATGMARRVVARVKRELEDR